jgi:perosamine synthetase
MNRIPVSGPWITQKEIGYVADAAANAWYANANTYHQRFERAFADYVQVKHAVALPSCTSAIHLSLLALGIGPGDEVIVPDVTWIATAAPIHYVGAEPVFADIDPVTWCLSSCSFEECITPRTRAVIPVDLYGGMPDWREIHRIAKAHDIAVVEDAAEAIGSTFQGRQAGSLGDTGVFSFHGSKTLTTGEGGMLVTNRDDVRNRVLFLRDHGRPPGDRFFRNTEVAFKYKMSALQAALGLAQLERIEELIARKREIFAWYSQVLGDAEGITLNAQPAGVRNTYWMVTAVIDATIGVRKEELMQRMDERGIDCRPFFNPLSSLPAYESDEQAAKARRRNANAYAISPRALNLPSGLNLTQMDVSRVAEQLVAVLDTRRSMAHR